MCVEARYECREHGRVVCKGGVAATNERVVCMGGVSQQPILTTVAVEKYTVVIVRQMAPV